MLRRIINDRLREFHRLLVKFTRNGGRFRVREMRSVLSYRRPYSREWTRRYLTDRAGVVSGIVRVRLRKQ